LAYGEKPENYEEEEIIGGLKDHPNTKTTMKYLWEILVPTFNNEEKHFGLKYHKIWDEKVRNISGGLTVLKTTKGQWIIDDKLFQDRMIPVRIYCTELEIDLIIQITMVYYHQEAILCYRISDLVKLVNKHSIESIVIKHSIINKFFEEGKEIPLELTEKFITFPLTDDPKI